GIDGDRERRGARQRRPARRSRLAEVEAGRDASISIETQQQDHLPGLWKVMFKQMDVVLRQIERARGVRVIPPHHPLSGGVLLALAPSQPLRQRPFIVTREPEDGSGRMFALHRLKTLNANSRAIVYAQQQAARLFAAPPFAGLHRFPADLFEEAQAAVDDERTMRR